MKTCITEIVHRSGAKNSVGWWVNLVSRVLRLLDQQVVARRDSGVFKKIRHLFD